MEPTRFQLEGSSLSELGARVEREYGPDARIVSAERVTVGGIGGFLARRHFEVVVEVPADARRPNAPWSGGEEDTPEHGARDPLHAPEHAVLDGEGVVEDGPAAPEPRTMPAPGATIPGASGGRAHRVPGAPASATATTTGMAGVAGVPSAVVQASSAAAASASAAIRATGPAAAVSASAAHALRVPPAMDEQAGGSSRPRGRRAAAPGDAEPSSRAGLLALLSEADGLEAQLHGRQEPEVSTGSLDFDRLMDGLTFGASPSSASRAAVVADAAAAPVVLPQRPARRRTPEPLCGPGDLVLVVGLGADASWAAGMLAGPGARVHCGDGATRATAGGHVLPRIRGRIEVVQARAAGVAAGEPVFVVFRLDHGDELESQIRAAEALAPDQLWVAVDAGRKSEDTRAWVDALDSACPVDAVAVFGTRTTATPETVAELGIPVRDIDAGPKPRTGLRSTQTR